jgi:myo-inositol-1(or 4)-monophosphatase
MAGSLSFLDVATALSQEAGASLLETFGGRWEVAHKADNSVVTAADARAERIIADGIRRHFPGHSIIGEESGCDLQASDIVWVIDPLDGTSNYASGIPWFGVLIGVMQRGVPVAGVMYLPAAGDLYAAEAGGGAFRDGQRVTVTQETRLSEVLWAYGMDAGMTGDDVEDHVRIVTNLVRRTRNVRATNSLVDAAYTAQPATPPVGHRRAPARRAGGRRCLHRSRRPVAPTGRVVERRHA